MKIFAVFVVVAVVAVVILVEDNLKKSIKVSAEPIKRDFDNQDVFKKVIRDVNDSNQEGEEEDKVFVRVKRSPDPNPQPRGGGRGGGGGGRRGGGGGGGASSKGGSGGSRLSGTEVLIVWIVCGVFSGSVIIGLIVQCCCFDK